MEHLTTGASVTEEIAHWGFCPNSKSTEMLEVLLQHPQKKAFKKNQLSNIIIVS